MSFHDSWDAGDWGSSEEKKTGKLWEIVPSACVDGRKFQKEVLDGQQHPLLKAAEEKYGKTQDAMLSTESIQILLSFPVLYPFLPYFLHLIWCI